LRRGHDVGCLAIEEFVETPLTAQQTDPHGRADPTR
jgi:hypothetical protein